MAKGVMCKNTIDMTNNLRKPTLKGLWPRRAPHSPPKEAFVPQESDHK